MIQMLIKPLLGVAGDMIKGVVETKKAKATAKLTEIKAATALKEQQIAGKVSWEASAVDQMKRVVERRGQFSCPAPSGRFSFHSWMPRIH